MENQIRQSFEQWKTGENIRSIVLLPQSGSNRKYFRIYHDSGRTLGVYNPGLDENEAYFSFTRQFRNAGLNVPEILHIAASRTVYFVEDLGNTTLFSLLPADNGNLPNPANGSDSRPQDLGNFPSELKTLYKKVIHQLIAFQTAGYAPDGSGSTVRRCGSGMDYTHVFPVAVFDASSMEWDLNYFKYFFLRLRHIPFSEDLLQKDFDRLTGFLNRGPHRFFMYRDFQSRNIMIKDGEPWFIDFQGGRKGPLAYDLASLLYDAKANLPDSFRQELFETYLRKASEIVPDFDPETFGQNFHACRLLRILQAMGAYGLRGFHERKPLFLKSIPYAIRNLSQLEESHLLPVELPEISRIIEKLKNSELASFRKPSSSGLKVSVFSFSYKTGLPPVTDSHGGGFVFDCRFLPNPGRIEAYRNLTGRNREVIDYLNRKKEVSVFLQNCFELVKPAICNYIERDFTSLSIGFGCTGGQHRSVYCAERMCDMLRDFFDIEVVLTHTVHPE